MPLSNIVNYDETNLSDDPGKRKVIIRRGTKYPERVINSSKSSTSVMFAAAADGTILPPYVVYKACTKAGQKVGQKTPGTIEQSLAGSIPFALKIGY